MDIDEKKQKENEARVAEEYLSSLSDLNCNSKPLINMLTMLADENINYAPVIVNVVQNHIAKVSPDIKLPILYLIDSIIKNVKSTYVQLFSQCIVNIFCGAFETVNEKVRERMYALRQTWNEVFTPAKLYALDIKVKRLDNNWPITAKPAPQTATIHVNPKFLAQGLQLDAPGGTVEMEDKLKEKTRELLELKKLKLELELEATKKFLQEQEQQLNSKTEGVVPVTLTNAAAATGAIVPAAAAALVAGLPNVAAVPGQMLPNAGAAMPNTVGAAQMRPTGMYNPNFRHARPQGYGQMPTAMQQQAGFGMNMAVNNNKTKVNPVNPALLSSFRHRDPRLARKNQNQQLQQQQQQQQQFPPNQERYAQNMHNADAGKVVDIDANDRGYRGNSRGHTDAASRGSKSPSRHNSAGSNQRNAGRSGKSSNSRDRDRDSEREKERERERDSDRRRRNDSKSSSSGDRRKGDSSASSRSDVSKKSHHNNNDYNKDNDASSSAYKRKSSSPAGGSSSPLKGRDPRRSAKSSRHYSSSSSRSKHHSRSPSPARSSSRARSNSSSSDIRNKHSKSKSPPPPLAATPAITTTLTSAAAPEKRRKLSVSAELETAATAVKDETTKLVTTAAFSNVVGVGGGGTKDLEKTAVLLLAPPRDHATATAKPPTKPSTVMDIDLRQLLYAPPIISSNKSNKVIGTTTKTIKQLLPAVFLVSDDDDDVEAVVVESSAKNPLAPKASILCSSNNVKNSIQKTSTSSSSTIKTTSSTSSTIIITNTNTATTTTTTMTTTTTNIPKVSFKIQKKSFNKLEKSTENLSTASSTATATTTAASAAATTTAISASSQPKKIMKRRESKLDDNDVSNAEEDSKKRIATIKEADEEYDENLEGGGGEPIAKKPKPSTKIDELFGTEDVDLRTEMLIPPPPMLTAEERNVQNWDHLKAKVISPEKQQQTNAKRSSTLDDVRAKLAKAAKFNKQGKYDISKASKLDSMSQRLNKLADMNMNEEALEANDEKIRTIISQAQEMLEANNIDNEQYKNLVETVMCINESNKLKVAKRRESLTAQRTTNAGNVDDERSNDAERLAAREAVLKKRIPKLPKKLAAEIGNDNASPLSDGNNATRSPLYDDKPDEEQQQQHKSQLAPKPQRERRNKPSKWGDRVADATVAAGQSHSHNQQQQQQQQMLQQRQWMLNMNAGGGGNNNKRGGMPQMNAGPANFRPASVPNPPVPPAALLNNAAAVMHMGGGAPAPWHGAGGGGNAMAPFMHQNNNAGINNNNSSSVTVPPPPQPPALLNLPPKPCNSIDNPQADMVRTITIDGAAKEIRIYDNIAIVFMELDTPREIGFQPGTRCIYIDNQDAIPLHFNDDYKPFLIDGTMHRFRFGFPSRELYIDDQWYEIYFGGPPVSIPIGNHVHIIKAEGPPPQVNIGPIRRDLVAGKIGMIVDALLVVSLFLDARVQTFQVGDSEHTVQFADNFLTVLLDGEPHKAEYGQLPKSYKLSGKKYFIRFNSLPKGVEPGKVFIRDMIYVKHKPPTEMPVAEALPMAPMLGGGVAGESLPMSAEESITGGATAIAPVAPAQLPTAALKNINIDELFQKLVSSGILSSALPVATPVVTTNAPANEDSKVPDANTAATKVDASKSTAPSDTKASAAAAAEVQAQKALEPIVPINLAKSESIKTRQPAIIATLYTGMQCSSCGVRFPLEQTIKYSQHLDWHFRQNRRERDASRKAHFRKWYYELSDWVQYEEIEDLDEREKNFFEAQQSGADMDAFDDASNQRSTNSPVPSCPAGPDDVDRQCDMCHEKFEQFYNEELEEWHLRSAKRVEDKIYHPLCYEDYKASLLPPKEEEKPKDDSLITDDDNAVDIEIKKEDDKDVAQPIDVTSVTINDDDDDDDDVIVLPNEEPSVTEIVDDDDEDEYVPANVTREEMGHNEELAAQDDAAKTALQTDSAAAAGGATEQAPAAETAVVTPADAATPPNPNESLDADVVIQEPHIPFTDLDTYVEKELPEMDENSQLSFLNVKIKEEPKDDEDDEDDGFEDVGTVLIQPDEEISLHSNETQTQTIISLNSANSPQSLLERPASAASQHNEGNVDADVNADKTAEDSDTTKTTTSSTLDAEAKDSTATTDAAGETTDTTTPPPTTTEGNDTATTAIANNFNNSLNADFESESSEHNLSAAGPAPLPMPLANLVNKIKINITKNSNSSHSSNNHNSNNSSNGVQQATTTTGTNNSSSSTTSAAAVHSNISQISTLGSTIPVLCSGGSMMSKFPTANTSSATAAMSVGITPATSAMAAQRSQQSAIGTQQQQQAPPPSNVSSISVIGSSYGSSSTVGSHHHAMLSSMMRIQPSVIKPIPSQQPTAATTVPTNITTPVASAISTSTLTAIRPAKTPTPPSVEDSITYELKPALKSAQLKKMKKIERGVETSGLCSIM